MAELRLFLQNRSTGQIIFRIVFLCSVLLNVYFLFVHDKVSPKEPPESGPVVVQGVTISEGNPAEAKAPDVPAPQPPRAESQGSGAGDTVMNTAGQVLDSETGLRLLAIEVERSIANTFSDALGAEAGDIMSAVFSRIFVWELDLRSDIRKSDRIQLVYRILTENREVDIQAAVYHSIKHKQDFEAYWFKPASKTWGAYYDDKGTELALRLENPPIKEYEQITSLLNDRARHHGIDFKTPLDTPIYCPFKGKVVRVNWRSANGNCIEIRYTDSGLLARFLHLNRILPGVSPGKTIEAGTQIAESGNTGRSTAPHLHYELARANDSIVDPLKFHKTSRLSVPPESMPEFEQIRDHWRKLLQERT